MKKKPIKKTLPKAVVNRIVAQQKREFPDDPAMQWVHSARKIISRQAQLSGMTFGEYIRATRKKTKGAR
jgi:hypothetical protein